MSVHDCAVVVGATGSVGGAITERLCRAGVPVVAVARDAARPEELASSLPGITECPADIGDATAGDVIAAAVSGRVLMVVQATGLPPAGPLSTIDPDALGRSVSLKVGGLLRLVRAVDDRWSENARIVAIGGHYGSEPIPQTCGAGVTNAALANLVRQLADDYGPRGVTVHLVAPGPLDTPRLHRLAAEAAAQRGIDVEDVLEDYRRHSPRGVLTSLDDVAWAVTQLLDPEAAALHGSTLALDGGARRGIF